MTEHDLFVGTKEKDLAVEFFRKDGPNVLMILIGWGFNDEGEGVPYVEDPFSMPGARPIPAGSSR